MLPGKTLTPKDVVQTMLHRRWLILLPFAAGLALVPLIEPLVPEVYRSESLLMVVPQRVPDDYVKSTITASAQDRLPSINDQIMSRSRLERVIIDFDLYKRQRAAAPMEDVVDLMRSDIGAPQIEKGEQTFRISYQNTDPSIAQKVTARLASLFIEENSSERENLAQSTNVFLESQLQDAKQRLLEHEQKLEVFRRMHDGELPSQLESNLRAISSAQLLMQSTNEAINRASERKLLLERQLADARTLPIVVTPVPGANQQEATLPLAQQLTILQARLEQMKLRYKPDHPDVRATERSIHDLQAKVDAEAKNQPDASAAVRPLSREEQDRLKRIGDLEAELDVVARQLSVNQAEQLRLKNTLSEYQRKVELVPTRETDLVNLTRDYEVLKKAYDDLLLKWEDSKLSANLERRQIGEQFRIVDPASLPERPENQVQRVAIIFGGAIVGLVLGIAVALLLEITDSSLKGEEDISRVLALPVLAMLPDMATDSERRRQRRRRLTVDVAASTALVASLAAVAVWGVSQF
jgi:polysaccharide chain length determinant protein (PEP-CTERM system associated)